MNEFIIDILFMKKSERKIFDQLGELLRTKYSSFSKTND